MKFNMRQFERMDAAFMVAIYVLACLAVAYHVSRMNPEPNAYGTACIDGIVHTTVNGQPIAVKIDRVTMLAAICPEG